VVVDSHVTTDASNGGVRGNGLWWASIVVAALGYAWARAVFTHEYSAVPWKRLLAMDAPLPFGHRVLIPWLAGPFVDAGISAGWVFGVVEAVAFVVVVGFSASAATQWLSGPRARVAAAMTGAMLPLVYVLPRKWPLLYPWDGPALAVLAVGVWAATRRRYWIVLLVAVVGALNRETALLVALVVLAMAAHDPEQRPVAVAWAQLIIAAVLATRLVVAMALPDNPGPPIHWTIGGRGEYRVFSNLRYLAAPRHWPWLVVYVGLLPLAWPWVRRRVPGQLHRTALVGATFFAASMLVANVYEPRAWGESVYLVGFAVAVGACRGTQPHVDDTEADGPPWLRRIDQLTLVAVALGFAVFVLALDAWHFLPVAQWPMPR